MRRVTHKYSMSVNTNHFSLQPTLDTIGNNMYCRLITYLFMFSHGEGLGSSAVGWKLSMPSGCFSRTCRWPHSHWSKGREKKCFEVLNNKYFESPPGYDACPSQGNHSTFNFSLPISSTEWIEHISQGYNTYQ